MLSEIKRLLKAAKNSVDGWIYMLKGEPNIRYLLLLGLLNGVLGIAGFFSRGQSAVLFLWLCVVVGLEICNTAVEDLLDLTIPEYHPEVKRIKDMVSGAVFFCLIVYLVLVLLFVW